MIFLQNIALTIQFDGSNYHGWQWQDNALSVQQVLSNAIFKITGEVPNIIGCSRTDSGVHALEFVCNFFSNTTVPMDKLHLALNTKLPRDIRAVNCTVTDDTFHARYSAKNKTYIYKAYNTRIANPFLTRYAYHFPFEIDFDNILRATSFFVGEYDFSTFMATGGSQKTTVREVYSLSATKKNNNIEFEITANAYLYNMVRIISGTLLYVGCGRIKPDDIPEIVLSKNRNMAGITAGAEGLYLKKVDY